MDPSIPVPQVIWESLENTLSIALRTLTKDIAKSLGKSHEPLAKALSGKIKIHLVEDETSSDVRCTYMCQHPDTPAFLLPCGQPIMWLESNTPRCPAHLVAVNSPIRKMAALKHEDIVYGLEEDGTVYDGQGEAVGFYDGTTLTLLMVRA
jgi:hypothetical protein